MSADERFLQCRDCGTKLPIETTASGPCDSCGGALEVREGEAGHLIPEDVVDACDVVVRTYYGTFDPAMATKDDAERLALGALREALDFNVAGGIPQRLVDACVEALRRCIHEADPDGWKKARIPTPGERPPGVSDVEMVHAVLEQVGRMLRVEGGEAVDLVLGVERLDREKVTNAGQRLANAVRQREAGRRVSVQPALADWEVAAKRYGWRQ